MFSKRNPRFKFEILLRPSSGSGYLCLGIFARSHSDHDLPGMFNQLLERLSRIHAAEGLCGTYHKYCLCKVDSEAGFWTYENYRSGYYIISGPA